jgi:hypothetical protein
MIQQSLRDSWHHQKALGLMVEIVEKVVAARIEWPHMDHRLAAGRNHFLDVQRPAFEFRGDRAKVLDQDGDRLSRRRVHFGGLEQMILDRERQQHGLICTRDRAAQHKYERQQY